MKTKICKKCKKEKDLSKFSKDKTKKDRLQAYCKLCNKKYKKKYYQKNKEKQKIAWKKYRKNNPEKVRAIEKRWRDKHPYYTWAYNAIYHHKQRGCKIKINLEELKEIAKKTIYCPICGIKLIWQDRKIHKFDSPSLDRINNENILTLDNIQIICSNCNATKRSRTMNEFINYCEMVYKKFKGD